MARSVAELLAGRVGFDDWLERLAPEVDNGRDALAWALANDAAAAIEITPGLLRALTTARLPERTAIADATEPLVDAALPAPLRAAWYQAVGIWFPRSRRAAPPTCGTRWRCTAAWSGRPTCTSASSRC